MSLTPGFAPDARSQWQELSAELQECVLDELDKLAEDPPTSPRGVILHDFIQQEKNARHYVFLRIVVDSSAGRITVIGVNHHTSASG
jgi:hypothetical protein